MAGTNHPAWRPDGVKACKNCGAEFTSRRHWEREKVFCNYACSAEYRRKNGGHGAMSIGSVTVGKDGYAYIKVSDTEWRYEHTVIAERMTGRRLYEDELVHHRNGIKSDNKDSNLLVVTRKRHQEIHAEAEAIGLSVMCSNEWMPTAEGMGC